MATDEISVVVTKLPGSINAFVHVLPSGRICVVINDMLSPMARREAFEHEIMHLARNDLYSSDPVEELEKILRLKLA